MESYYYSIIIISIGVFLDSIHSLYYYKKYYSEAGIFNLRLINSKSDKGFFSKTFIFLSPFINNNTFYYLLLTRLILSVLLILFPSKFYGTIFLVFVIQLLFNLRNKLALSGADQMRTILLFGLSIMSFKFNLLFIIGLLFIILQLYISYFFTGYNKIKSPVWRNGKAMIWVLNSNLFGNHFLQSFLIKRGKLFNQILCWGIILFQLLFPFIASINCTVVYILFMGFIFHLSLAFISNLNDFFWTYTSAYPLVYFFTKDFSIYNYL